MKSFIYESIETVLGCDWNIYQGIEVNFKISDYLLLSSWNYLNYSRHGLDAVYSLNKVDIIEVLLFSFLRELMVVGYQLFGDLESVRSNILAIESHYFLKALDHLFIVHKSNNFQISFKYWANVRFALKIAFLVYS